MRYCIGRIGYYSNGMAAFNLAKSTILKSMDIESNPGPNSAVELDSRCTKIGVRTPEMSIKSNLHCGLINYM